jgi:cobalt-zinc-cadmium efflux system membrane fusion protein
MNRLVPLCLPLALLASGCGRLEKKVAAQENLEASTGPLPAVVVPDLDSNNFKVDHPERFPLSTAGEHAAAPELNVTGVVQADVSRQVPVPSRPPGASSRSTRGWATP